MKHILFILPYLNLGGTEKQAYSLIEKLTDTYKISLLAPQGDGAKPFQQLPIKYIPFTKWEVNFFKGITEVIKGIKEIKKEKTIDLVHVHAAHELMLPVKLVLPKTPLVFTVHGYHGSGTNISYKLACLFSNFCADNVISVCQTEFDILSQFGLKKEKLNLIYNGVKKPITDTNKSLEFANQFNFDPQKNIVIGTAARLNEAKGLTYLLQGFAQAQMQLSQSNIAEKNLILIIAGTGELETSLKEEAENLGIANQVIFTGYVDDLLNLMQLFDIFVLPSLQEAASLACVEAMSLGKAIIGTSVGGIPEQVEDNVNGFIIEPRNPQQIADKLIKLIKNNSLRQEFGQNSYQRYQENFSSDMMIAKTVELYEAT